MINIHHLNAVGEITEMMMKAKKPNFIEDNNSKEYKEQLKAFQQVINPKDQQEIIDQLIQKYKFERGM